MSQMQKKADQPDYLIDVRRQLTHPNEPRQIDLTLSAETAALYGIVCEDAAGLPRLTGTLTNRAGVLMLRYRLRCVPALECDRCLAPVHIPMDEEYEYVVVTETASEQNDAEYLLAPDAMLDLAETAMTDLRLSLPTKILCRPDCLGICPVCGSNRNESHCTCVSEDITQEFQ